MLKTGTKISQTLSQKLIMVPSYEITAYKQTVKATQTSQIKLLKIKEKKCRLIVLKIPAGKNVSVAEFKKLPKYRP